MNAHGVAYAGNGQPLLGGGWGQQRAGAAEKNFLQLSGIQLAQQMAADPDASEYAAEMAYREQLIRYSVIVVSSAPLLIVYPFLQKYFDKGVMIGSVKG